MRLTPIVLSLGLAAATMAGAGHGQRPDDQIDPRSIALVKQGETLLAAGQATTKPIDLLETALAVDPRNRAAFIALAGSPRRSGCPARRCASDQQGAGARAERRRRARRPGRGYGRARRRRRAPRTISPAAEAVRQAGCPQAHVAVDARSPAGPARGAPAKTAADAPKTQLGSAARASATKSSTLSVSARRSDRCRARQRLERARHALQARAQHLAALAEGGGGEPFERRRDRRPRARGRARCGRPPTSPWAAARRRSGGPSSPAAASHRHWASTASRP